MQDKDTDVLLCADANADILDPDFQEMIRKTGLIDLMAHKLGPDLPETYIRGTKTVDIAYGSPRLAKTVARVGYLAYNDGILSDHRGFFIDFYRNTLFGPDQNVETREARLLSTTNKRGASQYRTKSSESIISNNILRRLQEIEQAALIQFSPQVQKELETVDEELHKILLDAENNIASHSHVPWSPTLHKAYQVWKYWKIRLSYFKNRRIPGTRIKELLTKWENDYEVQQGKPKLSISKQLRKAKKRLTQCRQNSSHLRNEHMERIAIAYEIDDDPLRAKIIKRIIRAEEQAKMYRTLRRYLKPPSQSVTYVEVPTDPNEDPNTAVNWRKIFDKDELEKVLHARNKTHFSQAATDRTPFTTDPLYSLLGFTANTSFGDKFRKNDIDLDLLDLDDDVYELLEELLPKADDLSKISDALPIKEVMSGFRKWNENTTTGGRHLGHYKTWLMKRPKEEESLSEKEFFQILITIYRICITNQYPLKRWKTCLNLFIPKDPGSCKLHRLRVIHIVDTCLNFLRRFFIARRLLHHLHDHHKLATEQWGGIPGRTAIDLTQQRDDDNKFALTS